MFNGCQLSVISFQFPPLKVLHCLHQVLNSHFLGMSLGLTNAFIHYAMCPWRHLNHSAPIFTSDFFLRELIMQHCCSYCFSLALLNTGSHIVLISMLGQLRGFLWPSICADSLSLRIFQWCSLSMISTWSHRERWSAICGLPRLIFLLPHVLQPSGVFETSP